MLVGGREQALLSLRATSHGHGLDARAASPSTNTGAVREGTLEASVLSQWWFLPQQLPGNHRKVPRGGCSRERLQG